MPAYEEPYLHALHREWLPPLDSGGFIDIQTPTFKDDKLNQAWEQAMTAIKSADDPEEPQDRAQIIYNKVQPAYIRYMQVANERKAKILHCPAYLWGAKHWISYIHQHHLGITLCTIKITFQLIFMWSEIFAGSIPKPMPVKGIGTLSLILEYVLYLLIFGIFVKKFAAKWWLRMCLAALGLVNGTMKDVLVTELVPNSKVVTSWDMFNIIAPAIVGTICIVQAARRPHVGYTPAFTKPGQIFDAFYTREVQDLKWLTEAEKGILHEALLFKYHLQ